MNEGKSIDVVSPRLSFLHFKEILACIKLSFGELTEGHHDLSSAELLDMFDQASRDGTARFAEIQKEKYKCSTN